MDFSGLEKFSLVDYETKLSAVLFFAGCNFRCPFCHNRSLVERLEFGPKIPFEEILDFLKQRKNMLDAVVITGGEATLMPDLKEKIIKIRSLGYLIKLDTNGTNPVVLKDLLDSNILDYVAMDIKNSLEKYPLTTDSNVLIKNIKQSIDLIINSGVDHEFRTTVVKEYHTLEDMEKIALLIKGAKRMRIQKFVLSENCIRQDLHEIDELTAKTFVECIKKTISDTSTRGY